MSSFKREELKDFKSREFDDQCYSLGRETLGLMA